MSSPAEVRRRLGELRTAIGALKRSRPIGYWALAGTATPEGRAMAELQIAHDAAIAHLSRQVVDAAIGGPVASVPELAQQLIDCHGPDMAADVARCIYDHQETGADRARWRAVILALDSDNGPGRRSDAIGPDGRSE